MSNPEQVHAQEWSEAVQQPMSEPGARWQLGVRTVVLVLRTAIIHGRTSALTVALAHGVGISLYALAVVLGLAVLIQSSRFFMNVLQMGGALFLLYLGCRMLVGGVRALTSATKEGVDPNNYATSKDDTSAQGLLQHAFVSLRSQHR